jgi:hypothetical protein
VVRGAPGTPEEQVGVFHTTFGEFLLTDPEIGVDGSLAHAALADAIGQLAPADAHDPSDLLHRYAARAEAKHLWASGRGQQVITTLRQRVSQIPAANLAQWAAWQAFFGEALGPNHPATLASREEVARWVGETGDTPEALRLYQGLLGDTEPGSTDRVRRDVVAEA